jgi:RimJ/RimL family protein N-acetyltransferase
MHEAPVTVRPATMETERLVVVSLLPEELEALIARDVERASRLVGFTFPPGWPEEREAREGLSWHLHHLLADPAHISWRVRVVVERSSGCVVGSINLKGPPNSSGDAEIGWGIVPASRRQGYALEATAAVIIWAMAQPGMSRISATVPDDNIASQRVAARLGMVRTVNTRRSLPVWQYPPPNPARSSERGSDPR